MDLRIRRRAGPFALDIALTAGAGVTAVFGPSGAGKTTLARCVAGLTRPDEGRIALNGRVLFDARTNVPAHRRGVGYVFQEPRLFPHLDVLGNLLYGADRGADPRAVAEMLGIGGLLDRRVAGLSGGEAARIGIGRALLRQPDILVLDEPLASLDLPRRDRILPWLEGLRDAGMPILYISHAIEEVARLADTLIVLRDGQVARTGSVDDVLSDPATAALIGPGQAGAVLTGRVTGLADGLAAVATPAGVLHVAGAGPMGTTARVRIRTSDVIVATEAPRGISALNVLPARVEAVQEGQGPGVMLRLSVGEGALLARLTRRSFDGLGLAPGSRVWAIVKTSTVARADVGGSGGT
nr:molybdenum ABC transporter ATP-binding protein [Jannaschia sp. S6380]